MTTKIPKINTIHSIEALLNAALKEPDSISTPLGFKKGRIGARAALIQCIITCFRRHPDIKLLCRYLNLDDTSVDKFLDDPCCLIAVLMAKDLIGNNNIPIKKSINSQLVKRFDTQVGKVVGRQLQLITVDHSIEKFKFPSFFYDRQERGPVVKEARSFANILAKFLAERCQISTLTDDESLDFGQLLSELILNTDQHALTNIEGHEFDRSVRGIILDYHLIKKGGVKEYTATEEGVYSKYLQSLSQKRPDQPLHLLEVSLFDSGEGLYQRHQSCKINEGLKVSDELEVIRDCFKKHGTSKKDAFGYGNGLYRVFQVLNKRGGFMMLRTGRLMLYRDFSLKPLCRQADVDLYDVVSDDLHNPTSFSEVDGAAYTLVVPIK